VLLTRVLAGKNELYLDFAVKDFERFVNEYSLFKDAVEKSLRATIPGNFQIHIYINGVAGR
jgi:hypothetical protein